MLSLGIVNYPERIRFEIHIKGSVKMEFSIQMKGDFFIEFYAYCLCLVILHPWVLNMNSLGHHGEDFKALRQVDPFDHANIQESVVGNGLGGNQKVACKTPAYGNGIHEAGALLLAITGEDEGSSFSVEKQGADDVPQVFALSSLPGHISGFREIFSGQLRIKTEDHAIQKMQTIYPAHIHVYN